jgi:hypothetical protein
VFPVIPSVLLSIKGKHFGESRRRYLRSAQPINTASARASAANPNTGNARQPPRDATLPAAFGCANQKTVSGQTR